MFALLGVWLTNHHAANERAADRQHELDLERDRQGTSERAVRRDIALSALQHFSAQGEHLVRQLELTYLRDGRLNVPHGVDLDLLQRELEDSLLALELVATYDALSAAQQLVRMIRPWDTTYWDTDRTEEWQALGTFREASRRALFGELR